jgi:hypothetical protein
MADSYTGIFDRVGYMKQRKLLKIIQLIILAMARDNLVRK